MAESQSSDIANIVRRLVGAMENLPPNSRSDEGGSSTGSFRPGAGRSIPHTNVHLELSDRFQLPRASRSSSGRVIPRARSGRFVPYARGNTGGKAKSKSEREIVIKDVCLLPNPGWNSVPRRKVKETLVRQKLYIDAWSMDKSWSEEQLKREIRDLFEDRLEGGNDFEFVKAVGNSITKVALPIGQEATARVMKHIAGHGPVYVRALQKIHLSELETDCDSEEESEYLDTITQERHVSPASAENVQSTPLLASNSANTSEGTSHDEPGILQIINSNDNHEHGEFAALYLPPDEALQVFQRQMVESSNMQPININRNVKSEREVLRVYKGKINLQRTPVVYFYSFDEDGEDGSDVGGLTREFFQIVHDTVLSGIHPPFPCFEGQKDHLLPIHSQELQSLGIFKLIGRAIAHSILHGGPPFEGLATPVKKYLLTKSIDEAADTISIEDCPYLDIVELLASIQDAGEQEINNLNLDGSVSEHLFLSGCSMSLLTVHNKHLALSQILKHYVLLRRVKELDDIIEGLNSVNVQKFLSVNPLVAEVVFPTVEQANVSFTFLKDVIRVADQLDDDQQRAHCFFLQYLQQRCESAESEGPNVKDVLQFITGKREMPELLRVGFHSDKHKTLPDPDTCLCSVKLPINHSTLEGFTRAFDTTVNIQGVGYGHI